MAAAHEEARAALEELREALKAMPVQGDPRFTNLGEYHDRRISNIESDVTEHEERTFPHHPACDKYGDDSQCDRCNR